MVVLPVLHEDITDDVAADLAQKVSWASSIVTCSAVYSTHSLFLCLKMASFRNHRIVIASLFLPTTAVLGESAPPTPPDNLPQSSSHSNAETTIPAVASRLAAAAVDVAGKIVKPLKPSLITNASHTRQPSGNLPLKSIVDDLKDKVRLVASRSFPRL